MKKTLILSVLLCILTALQAEKYSISVERIWEGDYCAFTSLVQYKGMYYCTFREATAHHFNSKDWSTAGRIRVIASKNGKKWQSVAEFKEEGVDLRDPKLHLMPDGRMMLLFGGAYVDAEGKRHLVPKTCFTEDGKTYSTVQPLVLDPRVDPTNEWLWRLTWYNGTGYGVVYGSKFALMKTTDGIHYELVTELGLNHFPNETTIRFLSDGTMTMMVRTEEGDKHGMWGVSRPPYTDWEWTEMNLILGGPDYIVLNDTTLAVGTRSLYGSEKMMMLKGKPDGKFEEVCLLPSGGDDNSYPGMLVVGKELWVTYYSRHATEKASIYLAKMPLEWFLTPRTNKYYEKKW
ncbi:MAG: hypothetical protein K5660_07935 [Paludibacteraceae bacterium]|nr:hypothetical protein [Paludibacteraceae bacterium]